MGRPFLPEQVGAARAFVARVLGECHAQVPVSVAAGDGLVRVEVTDRCGDGIPVLPPAVRASSAEEGSRGLRLVDALSARWGYQRGGGLATTWFGLALCG